jgi:hypothetical protein
MRDWLGHLNVFTWIWILCVLILLTRKLLDFLRRPKVPRPIIDWPKRPMRPVFPAQAALSSAAFHDLKMLLVVTLHDRPAVDRLILHEMHRLPGISRDEAISLAYQRWQDDNR